MQQVPLCCSGQAFWKEPGFDMIVWFTMLIVMEETREPYSQFHNCIFFVNNEIPAFLYWQVGFFLKEDL